MSQVFMSYSHRDEEMRNRLETHLAMLKRNGEIEVWHDRVIVAGDPIDARVDENIERADVVLLLVSPDFLNSEYCYSREMARALERHKAGEARVIPIILDHCDWLSSPLAKLKALPRDGLPIKKWPNENEAFLDVVTELRRALPAPSQMAGRPMATATKNQAHEVASSSTESPRSSNLRLRKNFTDADKDAFLDEAFAYMERYFEASLQELVKRNPGTEGRFRKLDANTFTAVIYQAGRSRAQCRVSLGSAFGKGINYSQDLTRSNSSNGMLGVEHDDQHLYMKAMLSMHGDRDEKLGLEGAAEHFWSMLIEPLQNG